MPRGLGEPEPQLAAELDERVVLMSCDVFGRHCQGIINIPCALDVASDAVGLADAVDPRVSTTTCSLLQ